MRVEQVGKKIDKNRNHSGEKHSRYDFVSKGEDALALGLVAFGVHRNSVFGVNENYDYGQIGAISRPGSAPQSV